MMSEFLEEEFGNPDYDETDCCQYCDQAAGMPCPYWPDDVCHDTPPRTK
jgi:hypothetical protein